MSLSRGRLLPRDDHGKVDYETIDHLWRSAEIDGLSLDEAVAVLIKTVEVATTDQATASKG